MPQRKPIKIRNRRLDVQITKTINIGNYESVKIQAGYAQDIGEKEEQSEVYNDMFNNVMCELVTLEEEIRNG